MAQELTRRELYDLVWARPVTKVAAEFGISDVALHKICVKHRVPVPGRGYWARLAAGKKVANVAFRDVQDAVLNGICITGPVQKLPLAVREARALAKSELNDHQRPPSSECMPPEEFHEALLPVKEKLHKAKADDDGFIHLSGGRFPALKISPTSVARALSVLDNLAKRAFARGDRLEWGPAGLRIVVDGEPIAISLVEKVDKVPHQPTHSEVARLARWQEESERRSRRGEWISQWDKPRIARWDYVRNAKLSLEIDRGNQWDGLRRRFSDGSRQRLEGLIDRVLVGLSTCAAASKTRREEAERSRREREERERCRLESERRKTLETKRWQFLERQMQLYEQARRIDHFIQEYESRYPLGDQPLSSRQLVEWARNYAEAIRDKASPERLAATIDRHRLMDDATEIGSWVTFV